jgi:predicted ester cyclase
MAEGDRMMVRWTMRAHTRDPSGLPATGRAFAVDGANILRIERERIVERLSYLAAAALVAQPRPEQR